MDIFPEEILNVDMDLELGAEVELKDDDNKPDDQKLLLETDLNHYNLDCILDDSSGEEDSWYNAVAESATPVVNFKNNLDSLTNQHVLEFRNAKVLPLSQENLKLTPSADVTTIQKGGGTVTETCVVENLKQSAPSAADISKELGRVTEMKEMLVHSVIDFESPKKVCSKNVIKINAVELPVVFHQEDVTSRKPFQPTYKCTSYQSKKQKRLHGYFICKACGMQFGYKNKHTCQCRSGSAAFSIESPRSQACNHILTCKGRFNKQPSHENDHGFKCEICGKTFRRYSHREFHRSMHFISKESHKSKMENHNVCLQPQLSFGTLYCTTVFTKMSAVQKKQNVGPETQKPVDTATSSQTSIYFYKLDPQFLSSNSPKKQEQHHCQVTPHGRWELSRSKKRTSLLENLWEPSNLQLKMPSTSELKKNTMQMTAESGTFGKQLPLSITSYKEKVGLAMEDPAVQDTSENNFQFPLSSDYTEFIAIKSVCEICGNVFDTARDLSETPCEEDLSVCHACSLTLVQDCHMSEKPKIGQFYKEPYHKSMYNGRKCMSPSPGLHKPFIYNFTSRHSCHDLTKTISHSTLSSDIDQSGKDDCSNTEAGDLKSGYCKTADILESHGCKTENVFYPGEQHDCVNDCVDDELHQEVGLENSWKKPFKCGLCGAEYVGRISCIEHMYTHLKEEFNSQMSPKGLDEFSEMHEACSVASFDDSSLTHEVLLNNGPMSDSLPPFIGQNASIKQESAGGVGDYRVCN
ncbi:uncharacterized protein LOC122809239 [Protopterus annectens]|uniref:uncharacterized protein LOC122809239 n=1 Tax=Protopterus annectens TaxID=7888 RepID=UPI001CFAF701|nr:uncharacterized protein LOC122809239 [Protopterus annectens]